MIRVHSTRNPSQFVGSEWFLFCILLENNTIDEMKTSFQAGVDSIYNAIVGQGTTPAGKTPAQLASAIRTMVGAVGVKVQNLNGVVVFQNGALSEGSYTYPFSSACTAIVVVDTDSADYGASTGISFNGCTAGRILVSNARSVGIDSLSVGICNAVAGSSVTVWASTTGGRAMQYAIIIL